MTGQCLSLRMTYSTVHEDVNLNPSAIPQAKLLPQTPPCGDTVIFFPFHLFCSPDAVDSVKLFCYLCLDAMSPMRKLQEGFLAELPHFLHRV